MKDATDVTQTVPLRLLEAAFLQSLSSIVITDADLDSGGPFVVFCNDAFCKMTGYPRHELIGKNLRLLQGPSTDPQVIDRLRQSLPEGRYFHGRAINYRKDGQPYFVEWNISAIKNDAGRICNYVSVQLNISPQIEAEMQRDVLAMALEKTKDCVMVTDESDRIVFVNKGFERLTGYRRDDVVGQPPFFVTTGEHALPMAEMASRSIKPVKVAVPDRYLTIERRDGSLAYVIADVSNLELEQGLAVRKVCIGKDVTVQVERRKKLETLAQTDPLTGLFNRLCSDEILREAITQSRQDTMPLSVIMCDIDHFKQVNDTFGHAVGDVALKTVASVLSASVRAGDPVFRWGGEEFLIVLSDCALDEARRLADRIRIKVSELHHDIAGKLTLSLGVAQWDQAESINALIERTDQALYRAKNSGRNRTCLAD